MFASDATLSVGDLLMSVGSMVSAGTLTVHGAGAKTSDGSFTAANDGLAGKAPISCSTAEGSWEAARSPWPFLTPPTPTSPSMQITGTFLLVDDEDSSASPFPCSSRPRITSTRRTGASVKSSAGVQSLDTMVVNDGVITVNEGRLILRGGTGGQVSDGAWRFGIASSASTTVRLKLPKALRRLLRRRGKVGLRLTARVSDPAGQSRTVRRRVAPRLR